MGLERIAAILQVRSNFETDFIPIIKEIEASVLFPTEKLHRTSP
jgi:alanyl-tRNA synthetase